MTEDLADLIKTLRTKARIYNMVGDHTPSMLFGRAADVIHLLSSSIDRGTKTERIRIVTSMRKWADDMDTPEWRDGWMPEIVAARTFAAQIEDGTL